MINLRSASLLFSVFCLFSHAGFSQDYAVTIPGSQTSPGSRISPYEQNQNVPLYNQYPSSSSQYSQPPSSTMIQLPSTYLPDPAYNTGPSNLEILQRLGQISQQVAQLQQQQAQLNQRLVQIESATNWYGQPPPGQPTPQDLNPFQVHMAP